MYGIKKLSGEYKKSSIYNKRSADKHNSKLRKRRYYSNLSKKEYKTL